MDIRKPRPVTAEAQSALIQQVRLQDSVSRVELARQLNLAPSTVGLYVDRLIGEGFLLEGRKARGGSGRPPITLELNPDAGEFIGVDFDARQIAATSVDFSQRVLRQTQQSVLTSDGVPQVLEKIEQAIAQVARRTRLLAIGVAVPGTVDDQLGLGLHYPHINGWQNVPLVERLSQKFSVPVHLENNVRSFALAEQLFGATRQIAHFVCIGIRSGIGAGVVIDGELHRGQDGLAGEIGGWPCEFSNAAGRTTFARLEEIASVRAILAHLQEEVRQGATTSLTLKRGQVTLEEMLSAARDGDPLVLAKLRAAAEAVGRVIAQFSLLLNPQRVVIAGPLAELSTSFLDPISETVNALIMPQHARTPEIVASQFGAYGGALGAAALAVHNWAPPEKSEHS